LPPGDQRRPKFGRGVEIRSYSQTGFAHGAMEKQFCLLGQSLNLFRRSARATWYAEPFFVTLSAKEQMSERRLRHSSQKTEFVEEEGKWFLPTTR